MTSSRLILTVYVAMLLADLARLGFCQAQSECNDTVVVPDSRVELVKLRQRTGFDGKVRSIRFGIDADNATDDSAKGQQQNLDAMESLMNLNSNDEPSDLATKKADASKESSTQLPTTDNPANMQPEPTSRSRRSLDKPARKNALDDLQADESKVFRPLFVYRTQVNRRLRLRNEKMGINSHASQSAKTSSHRHYHPYRYSPYRYYPSG